MIVYAKLTSGVLLGLVLRLVVVVKQLLHLLLEEVHVGELLMSTYERSIQCFSGRGTKK